MAVQDDVDLGIADHAGDAVGTVQQFRAARQLARIDPAGDAFVGHRDPTGFVGVGLLDEHLPAAMGA